MSVWSVWSPCSCESPRQQRYRVALSPATRGQQCTPVETQSRVCDHSRCAGELMQEMKCECVWVSYSQRIPLVMRSLRSRFMHSRQTEMQTKRKSSRCMVLFCFLHIECVCFLMFIDCHAPFVYSACGAPCEKQCALRGRTDVCLGGRECTPGCYCPQVPPTPTHTLSVCVFMFVVCMFFMLFLIVWR